MKTKPLSLVVAVALVAASVGCTFPYSRRTVPRSQVGLVQTVEPGIVTSARVVDIEGERSPIGVFGGGMIGSAATKPAAGDSSRGAALIQAGGAVAGAVVGSAVEEVVTRKTAQEITVRLDDGRTVVVTQVASGGLFRDGDRVHVLNGGGARVTLASN
jgi:outer membrane lipoprotein SlyB